MDVEILVPIAFFAVIGWIVKVISDNRIRRKVLDQRVSDELAEAILKENASAPSALGALKWGLIVLATGGALVLVQLLSIDADEPLTFGLLFLAAGAGLIAYYLIASQDEQAAAKRDTDEYVPDFSSSEER
jgi:hypothetical protein